MPHSLEGTGKRSRACGNAAGLGPAMRLRPGRAAAPALPAAPDPVAIETHSLG